MVNIKPTVPARKAMASPIKDAIRTSGGVVPNTKVATPVAEVKKANMDVLKLAVHSDADYPVYLYEKNAGWVSGVTGAAKAVGTHTSAAYSSAKNKIFPAGSHVGTRWEKPRMLERSGHDPIWGMVPGAIGAYSMYASAKNEGQGTLPALGLAALGGIGGRMVGNRLGSYVWNQQAPARAAKQLAEQKSVFAKQKYFDKFKDPNAAHQAIIDQQKGLWNEPGILNKVQGGIAHVKDKVNQLANPGMSAEDTLDRHFSGLKGQAEELQSNMLQAGKEHLNETQHYQNAMKDLDKRGIDAHKLNAYLSRQGYDAQKLLNNPNYLTQGPIRGGIKEQGLTDSVYDQKWFRYKVKPAP